MEAERCSMIDNIFKLLKPTFRQLQTHQFLQFLHSNPLRLTFELLW